MVLMFVTFQNEKPDHLAVTKIDHARKYPENFFVVGNNDGELMHHARNLKVFAKYQNWNYDLIA